MIQSFRPPRRPEYQKWSILHKTISLLSPPFMRCIPRIGTAHIYDPPSRLCRAWDNEYWTRPWQRRKPMPSYPWRTFWSFPSNRRRIAATATLFEALALGDAIWPDRNSTLSSTAFCWSFLFLIGRGVYRSIFYTDLSRSPDRVDRYWSNNQLECSNPFRRGEVT